MSKWIVLLATLLLALLICFGQSTDPQLLPGIGQSTDPQVLAGVMRPVKQLPSQRLSTAEIQFSSFEFLQLIFTHHPGTSALEDEPTKGVRYFVEAKFYGEEVIATAKFEAVDEHGNVFQKILIGRQPEPGGGSGFYGVMEVPDRPFRVMVSGEGMDGRSYSLTYERLFRPTSRPNSAVLIPSGRRPLEAKQRQQFEAVGHEYIDKMERDLRKSAGEMIVIPRARVSNVMYTAYLSKTGLQLGVRITFDVEFSHDGYFNPEMRLVL
jgi:hypothetical protein